MQFDADIMLRNRKLIVSEQPAMIRFVMKASGGLVKNTTQAAWVLVGLIVVLFIVSAIIMKDEDRSKIEEKAIIPEYIMNDPRLKNNQGKN